MSGSFDPRDNDTRERDDGVLDREDQHLTIGRGSNGQLAESIDHDALDRDLPATNADPRDAFVRDLGLPAGPDRELVRGLDRDYVLNGSDTRTLATVGAFRVVSERDLRGDSDSLRHLERQGLIERAPVNDRERAITPTDRGLGLLEHHRDSRSDHRQAFYAGADKARERTHDVQIYRAYLREADNLRDRGATVVGVKLDRELKRDYQRFLQERNRGDRNSDGRPDRSREEVEAWAREHDLPYFDEQVHFPDARIEYRDVDGDVEHLDLEVTTEHYRGGHGAAAARSGFSIHSSGGGSGRGAPFDPRAAEEFL